MLVYKSNYIEYINKIGVENLTPAIKKMHDLIMRLTENGKNWENFERYPQIGKQFEAVGLLWEKLSKNNTSTNTTQIKKHPSSAEQKPKKTVEQKPRTTKTSKEEKPVAKGKNVELVSPEVTFIKRFALLHNKEKNRQQVLNFIKAIQKAIVECKIKKTSKYASVIAFMQKQLVNTYNKMEESIGFSFTHEDYMKYLKIAGAEYLMPSVRFIKSYIGMLGQTITKEKANNLLEKITKAIEDKHIPDSDKYFKHIRTIM